MRLGFSWKRLSCALFMVLLGMVLPSFLLAHAPEHHQFKMVSFNRPFPAPSFSLKDFSGNTVEIKDFQGKYVLLNFWATWCIPCQREMPSMERLYHHFRDKPFTIVAISTDVDELEKVEAFTKNLQLTFPILLDPQNIATKIYGAQDLPSSFLLDPQGRVIAAAKGERDWFSQEALSYLGELLTP